MKYLFPFEFFNAEIKRIYIYGAGKVGNDFLRQINENSGKNVETLGFIDNYATNDNTRFDNVRCVGIYKPEVLLNAEYDYVVLACEYKLLPELFESLFKLGVSCKNILTGKPSSGSYAHTPNVKESWGRYYEFAEATAEKEVSKYFIPMIDKHNIPMDSVLDFPSGRGRIAEKIYNAYAKRTGRIVCCDANAEAIDYCRKRFSGNDKFEFEVNKLDDWRCIPLGFPDSKFSFIYSWDAMVHFSYKWLDFYISEFYRMLQSGGFALIHHSNFASPDVDAGNAKSEVWTDNPKSRSLISAEDICFIAKKTGFDIVEQRIIDWEIPNLDCISLLRKL